jgi:hypothetical protein
MSPIRMFSVKLLEPTMIVVGALPEELPVEEEGGENPQALTMASRGRIIKNVKANFFVILLFSLRWLTVSTR